MGFKALFADRSLRAMEIDMTTAFIDPSERRTLSILRDIADETGDDRLLQEAKAWLEGANWKPFSSHMVLTTDYPLSDLDEAERLAQLIYQRVMQKYFGNYLKRKSIPPMGYLTIIEQHQETCSNGKRKLHLHILLGTPKESKRFNSWSKLKRISSNSVPLYLLTQLGKIKIGKSETSRFKCKEIGHVYQSDGILDYLMKQQIRGKLYVAVKASNLCWH